MNNDQMSTLAAALQRAAATMRGSQSGMVAPMPFGGPGMFNPTHMANQGQPGMQPTPNAQVADRFGGMQPPAQQPQPQQQPQTPMPMAQPPQAPQPQQAQPAPMGFFQRNAAMMRDPATGQLIDPAGAAQAQAGAAQAQAGAAQAQAGAPQQGAGTWGASQGILPHILNMMGAGTGAPGTNANGSIQGAQGPTSVGGAPLARPNQQQMGGILPRMLGLFGGMQG